MASWITWLLVVLGGIASAFQAPINTSLASHIRPIPASFVNFFVGTIVMFCLTLFTLRGQGFGGLATGLAAAPGWNYLGGLAGATMVTAVILGTAAFGVNSTLSVLLSAQLITSLLIDAFGLGVNPPIAIRWPQVVGVLLIIGGVRLVLWR